MPYAEVAVNSPIGGRQSFSYSIPAGLTIEVGQGVFVPFGARLLQGIVIELSDKPAVEETKDIAGLIETRAFLSPERVRLARWISEYYLSSLFDAVALMLPPGFERKTNTWLSPAAAQVDLSSLNDSQRQALELVRERGRVSLSELEKLLGKRLAQTVAAQLAGRGWLTKSYELESPRVKPRTEAFLRLLVSPAEAKDAASGLRSRRQAAVLEYLATKTLPVPWREVRAMVSCDVPVVNALADKGLVGVELVEVKREPRLGEIAPSFPPELTPAQSSAFEGIKAGFDVRGGVFLLRGVTGSGKTEVYLQALAEVVRRGKRGIVLVPEISLTPQTIERFAARFPSRVAVLHSRLSLGEQFDEWRRIRDGEFDVVIGSRSAVFAPQPDLGLIVMDEEHEWTYKEKEKAPRYHARAVALKLAELLGAAVVLGSATPDIESYYRARQGIYKLLELPERVTPAPGAPLPEVEVVDLREELKAGNRSIFSRSLRAAINRALASREQVILFLNRRGAASFIQCRNCGFALRCRRCDIPLTYHLDEEKLVCHQCNRREPVPFTCPQCRSTRIKFIGLGTEKLEQEARLAFPNARFLRWDSDVTGGKWETHREILGAFRAHEADILIGTQMVAKGLDLPLVTVVGVVNADISLNLPDFRAGERCFQLLSQVAGRAGRGEGGGEVVIQTYAPEHYAIQAAAKHDYAAFFERELSFRRGLNEPPFSGLASLVCSHTNEAACQREAERVKKLLTEELDSKGTAGIDVLGPAPAFVRRLRGRYRWQLVVRGVGISSFLSGFELPRWWSVDIDPATFV